MIQEITLANKSKIYALTTECVIHLHQLLSENYKLIDKMDPVEPPGIKNLNALESAVFRQHTGSLEWYKYDTVFSNCATLVFAVVKNHAFHNGNKRVAFLCMVKHLFENGYVISPNTKHSDIYTVLVALADNDIQNYLGYLDKQSFRKDKHKSKWSDEKIIEIFARWIRKNCESRNNIVKVNIRMQQIRSMLEAKGIHMDVKGTWITLYQLRQRQGLRSLFNSKPERVNEHTYGIGNSLSEVGIKVINQIRKDYNLTHSDGFDNNSFYDGDTFIDQEMVTYKMLIYKLSLT
ncbi:MAG: type II toxin-antitoxin system death-on-curing family toxin [Taibaiella sp.]|nr:type II toxin-antitoxin system death-on-curing family toxin [Taibaiella sp.]